MSIEEFHEDTIYGDIDKEAKSIFLYFPYDLKLNKRVSLLKQVRETYTEYDIFIFSKRRRDTTDLIKIPEGMELRAGLMSREED